MSGLNNLTPTYWSRSRTKNNDASYLLSSPEHLEQLVNTHKLDIRLIRRWIDICIQNHGASCGCARQNTRDLIPIKVIDCETRELCPAPDNDQYVALSYVWGSRTSAPKGRKLPFMVPQTIEDAITLTQSLGYRYLWVDRYCISQNDKSDKHAQVQQMDLIYGNAQLTIIAAAGKEPSYGLPGVSRPRKVYHKILPSDADTPVSTCPDALTMIDESSWSTRAWTYQEALLSRRCLVITDYQAYFECSSNYFYEAVNSPPCKFSSTTQYGNCSCCHLALFTFPDVVTGSLGAWKVIIDYTKLSLSHEEDILDGISGVFREFLVKNYPFYFHWGIPIAGESIAPGRRASRLLDIDSRFATALCWCHAEPKSRRAGFPSWSWSGWLGAVTGWIGRIDFQPRLVVMVHSSRHAPISFEVEYPHGRKKLLAAHLASSDPSSVAIPQTRTLLVTASVVTITLHKSTCNYGDVENATGMWARISVSAGHYSVVPMNVTARAILQMNLCCARFDGVVLGYMAKVDGYLGDVPTTAIMITQQMSDWSERVGFMVISYPLEVWREGTGPLGSSDGALCVPKSAPVGYIRDLGGIKREQTTIRLA